MNTKYDILLIFIYIRLKFGFFEGQMNRILGTGGRFIEEGGSYVEEESL